MILIVNIILILFIGLETIPNLIHMMKISAGDYNSALKQHGDIPTWSSKSMIKFKVISAEILGILALIIVLMDDVWDGSYQLIKYLFSGGLFLHGMVPAIAYGSKHKATFGGLIISVILALMIYI